MKEANIRIINISLMTTLIILIVIFKIHKCEVESVVESTTESTTEAVIEAILESDPEAIVQKPIRTFSFGRCEIDLQSEEASAEEILETVTEEAPTEPEFSGYDFIPLPNDFQKQVNIFCDEHDISFNIVMAVIRTESNFQMNIVGDNGNSIGLMQIQPRWWQSLANIHGLDIYEPIDNVHLGIIILTDLIKRNSNDLNKALKQYNSGNPNTTFTGYIDKVHANSKWLNEMGCAM